ncbi:MAG: hypothetical protein N2A99_02295 [Carnobacterium alterfunditum]
MVRNFAYERKEQMRKDLKVQLPVPIDSKRYLIGRIAFVDLLIISPFLLLSGLSLFLLYKADVLNQWTLMLSALPTVIVAGMQFTKHKVRKELSFIQYGIFWRYKFNKREKKYFYRKGAFDMADKQDARRKIGIKSVFADCYETNDNRFVRVFEISSVNLSLSNKSEKRAALETFKVFMTTINFLKTIQFSQIAQPINLTRHMQYMNTTNKNQDNETKKMLQKSYGKYIEEIQKSKDLVTRKRYLVISEKIGSDRDKALDQIDQKSKLITSKVEGMTFSFSSLSVNQLNNDELTKLMFTCVDYDSAVAVGEHIVSRASNRSLLSVGEESAKQMIETLTKQLKEKIN